MPNFCPFVTPDLAVCIFMVAFKLMTYCVVLNKFIVLNALGEALL